jgi:hypothetical protein
MKEHACGCRRKMSTSYHTFCEWLIGAHNYLIDTCTIATLDNTGQTFSYTYTITTLDNTGQNLRPRFPIRPIR